MVVRRTGWKIIVKTFRKTIRKTLGKMFGKTGRRQIANTGFINRKSMGMVARLVSSKLSRLLPV